jgi:hypothetical protein
MVGGKPAPGEMAQVIIPLAAWTLTKEREGTRHYHSYIKATGSAQALSTKCERLAELV